MTCVCDLTELPRQPIPAVIPPRSSLRHPQTRLTRHFVCLVNCSHLVLVDRSIYLLSTLPGQSGSPSDSWLSLLSICINRQDVSIQHIWNGFVRCPLRILSLLVNYFCQFLLSNCIYANAIYSTQHGMKLPKEIVQLRNMLIWMPSRSCWLAWNYRRWETPQLTTCCRTKASYTTYLLIYILHFSEVFDHSTIYRNMTLVSTNNIYLYSMWPIHIPASIIALHYMEYHSVQYYPSMLYVIAVTLAFALHKNQYFH